jgi:hypothetical protein
VTADSQQLGGSRRLGSRLTRPGPRSLTWAFYRHLALLVIGAFVVLLLGRLAPIEQYATAWLIAGLALGVLTALVSNWYGLLFLASGLLIGSALDLALRFAPTSAAADQLAAVGPSYVAMIIVAMASFALAAFARRQFA